MIGAGKYDAACTVVRESNQAMGCILIIVGGTKGNGFSAQFLDAEMELGIPSILREVADQIEADHKKGIT